MLRLGDSDYRLPPDIPMRENRPHIEAGSGSRSRRPLGTRFHAWRVERPKGFQRFFLGIGAMPPEGCGIQERMAATGVWMPCGFCASQRRPSRRPCSKVVVIGGGNRGVDAARVAAPWAAAKCPCVSRRSARTRCRLLRRKSRERQEEGSSSFTWAAPVSIQSEGGSVSGLTCLRTKPEHRG